VENTDDKFEMDFDGWDVGSITFRRDVLTAANAESTVWECRQGGEYG
jgi:hypothetical protein